MCYSSEVLVKEIKDATRKAIISLKNEHEENFYYFSLITDGEGHCPILSAWSYDALERELEDEDAPVEARLELKWSYADSPYCGYGESYFVKVKELFDAREKFILNDDDFYKEYDIRMKSMEEAMQHLDQEGLFGTGNKRLNVVINAEVMPPDFSNTERAYRLNPEVAIAEWLIEVAEEE